MLFAVTALCVPGRHRGSQVVHDDGVVLGLPPGWWSLVRATYDRRTGNWFADLTSPAKVCTCPEHDPGGGAASS